jgi:CRP-like cAMP-binding protein
MSASSAATSELTEKQRQILQYLERAAEGQTYFKSRLIAEDLGLSAKEVGANMGALRRSEVGIDIEKWGYSSGTTWKVTA